MKKLLLTLVACVTALAANAWKVYFTNPDGWNPVYIWAWNGGTNYTGGSWPGAEMTKDPATGLYSYSENTIAATLLFNEKGNGNQTNNFNLEDGAIYNALGKVPTQLYLIGVVNSIAWNPQQGLAMTNEGNGIFSIKNVTIKENFAFTSKLGTTSTDWSTYNNNRMGPDSQVTATVGSNNKIQDMGEKSWKKPEVEGPFDITVNLYTQTVTLAKTVQITYPKEFYIIGQLSTGSWSIPGTAFTSTGEGMFTLTDVAIVGDNGADGQFAFTTSGSNDWKDVNANRYGPATATPITDITGATSYNLTTTSNDNINWLAPTGVYTINVNLKDNTFTLKKTADYVAPSTTEYYLMLDSNGWKAEDGYQLTESESGVYTISLSEINGADEFKIATSNWTTAYTSNNTAMITRTYDVNTQTGENTNMALGTTIKDVTLTLNTNTNQLTIDGEMTLYISGGNINGKSMWGESVDGTVHEEVGVPMTYEGNGVYSWGGDPETAYILGSGFKIYDGDWSSSVDFGKDKDNATVDALTLGEPFDVIDADGCLNINFNGLSWIQNPTVTLDVNELTVTVTGNKPLYLRGEKILGGNPWKGEQTDPWEINNSYLFQLSTNSSGTAVYTLTVGSINAGDSFKIATEDWDPTYTANLSDISKLEIDKQYDLSSELDLSEADRTTKYNMALTQSLLNATFTLTMDGNTAPDAIIDSNIGPFTKGAYLYIQGTTTEEAEGEWVLTPGNDKTMQDGSVEGNTITLTTITDGALVYVYPPEGAVNVYFKLGNGAQSEKRRLTAADLTGFTQAAKYPGDDNAYMLPLPVGSGDATLYYEKEGGELSDSVTYDYNVTKGVPTGVEGIGADEEDAVYYNLQGVKVDNPEKGIFVKVVNGTASKVVL